MKKVLALFLALTMIFSLTACGGKSAYSKGNISVEIGKQGKTTLDITLKDTFDMEYVMEAVYAESESDDPSYSMELSKTASHKFTYTVRGIKEGSASAAFTYISSEDTLGSVSLLISVSEAGTVYFSDVQINKGTMVQDIGGFGQMRDASAGTKTIRLSTDQGSWVVGEFDDSIISISEGGISSEYNEFVIRALSVGECTAQFICESAYTQMIISFAVSEYQYKEKDSSGSEVTLTDLVLDMTDYKSEYYQPKTSEENKKIIDEVKKVIDIIDIPEEIYVEDINYTVTEEVGEKKEDKETRIVDVNPEKKEAYSKSGELLIDESNWIDTGDTVDMVLIYNGIFMDYLSTKLMVEKEFTDGLNDPDDPPAEIKTIEVGQYKATYYYFNSGCGAATWTKGEFANRLTFMNDDKTSTEFKDTLEFLLKADAL